MKRRESEPAARRWYYRTLRPAVGTITRPFRRWELDTIYRRDLTKPIPALMTGVPLEARMASRAEILEDVARLSLRPTEASRELYRHRLDHGFLCFIGRVGEETVAYNWAQYEPGEDGGKYVDLRPGEVHTLEALTAEPYRGNNIHGAVLGVMLSHFAALGYRCAYTRVGFTTRGTSEGHQQLGWEPVGRALLSPRLGGIVIRLRGEIHPWRRFRPEDSAS